MYFLKPTIVASFLKGMNPTICSIIWTRDFILLRQYPKNKERPRRVVAATALKMYVFTVTVADIYPE